ncbi:MAG: hypothetical protein DMG77_02540 [Acidobacteria bacterium]|nr:MAG: hypothetical protein DMG77_02540 [Acidobacteriota bacterium]
MYGPPPECKRNSIEREAVCENVFGLEWRMVSGRMMMIRACPSLLIATVRKDPYFNAGSRARHLTVEKALEMFKSGPQNFDVVVNDPSMPGMSGIDLAREFLQIRPGLPILIATGHILSDDNEKVRSLSLYDLILKPDTVDELGQILHKLFKKPEEHEGT